MTTTPKPTLDELRDSRANELYPPLHPAWLGEHNEAFKDSWDACQAEMQAEIDEAENNEAKLAVKCAELIGKNQKLREALEKIAKDFGTDHCDGNTMIAKEALEGK